MAEREERYRGGATMRRGAVSDLDFIHVEELPPIKGLVNSC
jgi:hypothetical protein